MISTSTHLISPITALAFVTLRSRLLLLVGEGPCLKVFDHETTRLLQVKRVFESQAVHGITATNATAYSNTGKSVVNLLLWGGRFLRIANLSSDAADGDPHVNLAEELQADNWILDACLRPSVSYAPQDLDAVLVTAHNAALHVSRAPRSHYPTLKPVTGGPQSILYSACIEWSAKKRIAIASGTVFGEVLLWSFPEYTLEAGRVPPVSSQLHYKFTGHEGSVFGVSISPLLSRFPFRNGKRLLASCSDDRTIRLWDISGLDADELMPDGAPEHSESSSIFPDDDINSESASRCVATVMGHASRIWHVRFLVSAKELDIISFGEDSTAQIWHLAEKPPIKGALPAKGSECLQLIHRQTYAYHSGKNIWASALAHQQDGLYTIATGGADGRTVSYGFGNKNKITNGELLISRSTMEDVGAKLEEQRRLFIDSSLGSGSKHRGTTCQSIFKNLKGTWALERQIRSALPSYPSGSFRGKATLEKRSPSTQGFDQEYLYTESGAFTADQGLTFQATRQYVYRYRHDSDTISAWFVKPDDRSVVDYLFHELRLGDYGKSHERQGSQGELVLEASGYHLCVDDHYAPKYKFSMKNGVLKDWTLEYQVKGPQKDYVAEGSYVRTSEGVYQDSESKGDVKASTIDQTRRNSRCPSSELALGTDALKSYVFLAEDAFLVTTAKGNVLLGSLPDFNRNRLPGIRWEVVGSFGGLIPSSITTKVVGAEYILLSGNDGTVYLCGYSLSVRPILELGRKAAFLYAQKLQHQDRHDKEGHVILATCLGLSVAQVYKHDIDINDSTNQGHSRSFLLSLPESFVVTSACYVEELKVWILGSRNGGLAFYDASLLSLEKDLAPCSVLQDVHGADAITVIQCLPDQKTDQPVYLMTAGRDGHYAVHIISKTQSGLNSPEIFLYTVHRSMPPFGPNVEGAAFTRQSHSLTLWGFRSKHSVVWNACKHVETMAVECGGAHRHWSYIPRGDGSDGGTFVWTKASVCNVYSQARASHQVFAPGGHGREIKAMAISPALKKLDGWTNRYIATGAEDTTIRIWSYDDQSSSEVGFRCLATLPKHTTGIQQLRWSDDGKLLFSTAGCEEFFAWRVQPVPIIGVGAVCEAACSKVTEDGDLRILDFCLEESDSQYTDVDTEGKTYTISVIYSDSSLRLFRYTSHPSHSQFTLLRIGTYSTNCLTQILPLHPAIDDPPHRYLCTASSDGHIALWPAFPSLVPISDLVSTNKTIQFSHRHRIHQNTIKCLHAIPLPLPIPSLAAGNQYLILSGGDDGAL
ncbi:MAG: hypothetical protein L6R39_005913, partial [Caloplaca ligustica]